MTKKLGGAIIDLGNVIIAHWLSNITAENFHTIDYNSIPEVPGVCEVLKRINELFGGNVTVVYNATGIADEKIQTWLEVHKFTERTGIPPERIRRTTNGRDKTPFMDQSTDTHYGTTMVVDDRCEVIGKFLGKAPNLVLFRPQPKEVEEFKHTVDFRYVDVVMTWKEIEDNLF